MELCSPTSDNSLYQTAQVLQVLATRYHQSDKLTVLERNLSDIVVMQVGSCLLMYNNISILTEA